MTTLVSLDVSRRRKEKEELKQLQKYEMGLKQTNLPLINFWSLATEIQIADNIINRMR